MAMTKRTKMIIAMSLVFLLIAGGVVLLLLFFNDNGRELSKFDRTEKLLAPKNLSIDEDWRLTFDKVDGAIAYYILIDGQTPEVVQTNEFNLTNYATVGMHTVSVRAMHDLASYHSDFSETISKAKYLQLDTPGDVSMLGTRFSWGSVTSAKSYELMVRDDKDIVTMLYSSDTSYSLEGYLEVNPNVDHFTVSVRATSEDRATGEVNEYILPSLYSESRTYHRASTVTAPVITRLFDDVVGVAAEKIISWPVDVFVDNYEVYFDGRLISTIPYTEYESLKTYSLNLNTFAVANSLMDHAVYIVAVPRAEDITQVTKQQSNTINYSVRDTLSTTLGTDILIEKEGQHLVISWPSVPGAEGGYELELQGKASQVSQYKQFHADSLGMSSTARVRYTLSLNDMSTPYQEVQARVKAKGVGYVDDSEWSVWSAPYLTITKLNPVGSITAVENTANVRVELSWEGDNTNGVNSSMIGSYFCRIYPAIKDGPNFTMDMVTGIVHDFITTDKKIVISDILAKEGLTAGYYAMTIITMPLSSASNFYTASDASNPVFFEYKTRLAQATSVKAVRENGVVRLEFNGDPMASKFKITVSGANTGTSGVAFYGEGEILVGEGFDGKVVDETVLNGLIGGMTAPDRYTITIQTFAPEGNETLLNSGIATAEFVDTFKLAAVSDVEFTLAGQENNEVIATWAAVPNAKDYSITIGNFTQEVSGTGEAVISVNITEALMLGDNVFSISCRQNNLYTSSDVYVEIYEYNYSIVATGETRFIYNADEGKVTVSIPEFDSKVMYYMVEFSGTDSKLYLTKDPETGVASGKVGFDVLTLYDTTNVVVTAGFGYLNTTLNEYEMQPYIKKTTSWTTEFVNDLTIDEPELNVVNEVLTISVPTKALAHIVNLEWSISVDGRSLYSDLITDLSVASIMGERAEIEINLASVAGVDGVLGAGSYKVEAKVRSTSGAEAEAEAFTFTKTSKLSMPSGFVEDANKTYLQWDAVSGAEYYEASVVFGDNAPVVLNIGSYIVGDGGNEREVLRVRTVELFSTYGLGEYVFSIKAISPRPDVIENSDVATYTWNLANALSTPSIRALIQDGVPYVAVVTNEFAEEYQVTVEGVAGTITKARENVYEQLIRLSLPNYGNYTITVKAVAKNINSTENSITFLYSGVAPIPDAVTATQVMTDGGVNIRLKWNKVSQTFMKVDGTTVIEDLVVAVRFSDLEDKIRYTYEVGGEDEQWIVLDNSGEFVMTNENCSTLLAWLNQNAKNTYLVHFKTLSYKNSSIAGEREILAESKSVPARLSYKVLLNTPTFVKLEQNEDRVIVTLKNLDSNASNLIDVRITKTGAEPINLSALTVDVGTETGTGETVYTYALPGEVFGERGAYTVEVRASKNGKYEASGYVSKTIDYKTPIGDVTNIKLTPTVREGDAEKRLSALLLTFTGINDSLAGEIAYSANIVVDGVATPLNFVNNGGAFELTAEDAEKITWVTGNKFTISITATPKNLQFITAKTTVYNYTVGSISAPTNFVFELVDKNLNVAWTPDPAFPIQDDIEYTYNLKIDGTQIWAGDKITTTPSVSIPLGEIDVTYPRLFEFVITSMSASSDGSTNAKAISTFWTKTITPQAPGALTISYKDKVSTYAYSATFTQAIKQSIDIFMLPDYSILINDVLVASTKTERTAGVALITAVQNGSEFNFSAELDKVVIENLLAGVDENSFTYKIVAGASVYGVVENDYGIVTNAGDRLVGYEAIEATGNVALPIVISAGPATLEYDPANKVASWLSVPYATKYEWTVAYSGTGVNPVTGQIEAQNVVTMAKNLADDIRNLPGGVYNLTVKVLSDTNVIVRGDASNTISINLPLAKADVSLTTFSNRHGDFTTSFSWIYPLNIPAERIILDLESVDFGADMRVSLLSGASTEAFANLKNNLKVTNEGAYYLYTYVLSGRKLVDCADCGGSCTFAEGADPTRGLLAGDYTVKLQILGDAGNEATNSDIDTATYQNKFGIVRVDNAEIFAVTPDCYVANVVNGEITYSSFAGVDAVNFNDYEAKYGYNRKYMVITDTGANATKAPNYRVLVNGVDYGAIDALEGVASLNFSDVEAYANKMSLSGWNPGINEISIMPWAVNKAGYYAYIEGNDAYYFDNTTSIIANKPTEAQIADKIKENLMVNFDITMYARYSDPIDPRLNKTFSDSAKHDLTGLKLSFGNSVSTSEYRVVGYYTDYYTGGSPKTFEVGEALTADFSNGNQGIDLFTYFEALGPHEIWFEVVQTGDSSIDEGWPMGEAKEEPFYINSRACVSEKFKYTIALPEFGDKAEAGKEISVVTAYNKELADAAKLAGNVNAQNGKLAWTLPQSQYSHKVEYTVSLRDTNTNEATAYSRKVVLVIDVDPVTKERTFADLEGNTANLFMLDDINGVLYFDMTSYFWNRENVRDADKFYLAGLYYYAVTAKALDAEGNQRSEDVRIYNPAQDTYGFKTFEFKNINYPIAPSNVEISSEGILTWTYDTSADIYSAAAPEFIVEIETFDVYGNSNGKQVLGPMGLLSEGEGIDLSGVLVAGGEAKNHILVSRVSPNSFYENSDAIQADMSKYGAMGKLPSVSATWTDKQNMTVLIGDDELSLKAINELIKNNSGMQIEISMLRLPMGVDAGEGATYASIKTDTSLTSQIAADISLTPIDLGDLTLINTTNNVDLFEKLREILDVEGLDRWISISNDNFIPGQYFVEVKLNFTNDALTPYFTPSVYNFERDVKDLWAVLDINKATLTGEFLTLKDRDTLTASPVNQNDRNWAEEEHKQAYLEFVVNALKDKDGKTQIPTKVAVRAKLWNSTTEQYEGLPHEIIYYLPALESWGVNDQYIYSTPDEMGYSDVRVGRYYANSVISPDYYTIRIDIHRLFDYTENYAANVAGVYHIEWQILEDSVGSASDAGLQATKWYQYPQDVCHYTVIATPILDYRLGMVEQSNGYAYVLNWGLTPNKFTYKVNDDIEYNVNIYAFEKLADGSYACDDAYYELDELEKEFFLQSNKASSGANSPYGFKIEYKLTDFGEEYIINGRRCYVNEKTNVGLELTPNNDYKFFVFLSPKTVQTTDPNAFYYLTSKTSMPVEYAYKEISTAHYNTSIKAESQGIYAIEGQEDFDNAEIYTLISTQDRRGYNNAFELFVYDTQDENAGVNPAWYIDQEANIDYLVHYIITTPNNASSAGGIQPLYIIKNHEDGVVKEWEYVIDPTTGAPRQIGTLNGANITLFKLTLADLVADKTMTPITYYCKIKPWIDNNVVNKNADVEAGRLDGLTVYGEDWLKRYITTDPTEIELYNSAITNKHDLSLGDFNALNPSYYFTFNHQIEFAKPVISKIEMINNAGANDLIGECSATYVGNNTSVTEGYLSSESNLNYYYKIWLNNVYNSDKVVQLDKYIKLRVKTYDYATLNNGEIDYSSEPLESQAHTTTLKVHYDDANKQAYVILSDDSVESNASDTFNWLDARMPNKVYFTATAVMGNPDQRDTTGGANTTNKFIPSEYDTNTSQYGYGEISRNFRESHPSETVSLTVRKQYVAPYVSFRYDTNTTATLSNYSATERVEDGALGFVETNVLSSGPYAGMALNPYLYVDGATYEGLGAQGGANGFEYTKLSKNASTRYKLVLSYAGDSEEFIFETTKINATMSAFNEALKSNSARYDYNTYKDIYPYEYACLYQKIYNLINQNSDKTNYHGGLISVTLQVVAPADNSTAGYWVSSEVGKTVNMFFSVRLETVKTAFNQNAAQFEDENGQLNIASMYTKNGYYYYYQGIIPFDYNTIYYGSNATRPVYRLYLTRENGVADPLVYSYDTLRAYNRDASRAEWSASAVAGAVNTGNLTRILDQDLFDAENSSAKNQWLLNGEWKINILAVASEAMQANFITRGFDSQVRTYSPKLKLVNDVTQVKVEMKVNLNTGIVDSFSENADDIISYTSSVRQGGNNSAYRVEFNFNNTTSATSLDKTAYEVVSNSSTDSYPEKYIDMFASFISNNYVNINEVIGGEYQFRFRFVTEGQNNLEESKWSNTYTFLYYRQINAQDIQIDATQSDKRIVFNGSVQQIFTIYGMEVGLYQNVIDESKSVEAKKTLSSTPNGDRYAFSGDWLFSQSSADCFSSMPYSQSAANLLTKSSYVSSANMNNIQAGQNTFRFYPLQSEEDAKYNILPRNFYVEKKVNFIVPADLGPKVTAITIATPIENGGGSVGKSSSETRACPTRESYWDDCDECAGGYKTWYEQHDNNLNASMTCGAYGGDGCGGSGKVECGSCDGEGSIPGTHSWSITGPDHLSNTSYTCSKCGAGHTTNVMGDPPLPSSGCKDVICGTCRGTKIVKCGVCGGDGIAQGYNNKCSGCGTVFSHHDDVSEDCPGKPRKEECDVCSGSGGWTRYKTCSDCNGSGYEVRNYTYTHYYAYFKYVSGFSMSYVNAGGASIYSSWKYGWTRCGNCTKSAFSSNGSTSNMTQTTRGITLSGANYVNIEVTISCKAYFDSVFADPSDSKTSSVSYASAHYEAYDGPRSYGSWHAGGSGSSSGGGSGGGSTTPSTPSTPTACEHTWSTQQLAHEGALDHYDYGQHYASSKTKEGTFKYGWYCEYCNTRTDASAFDSGSYSWGQCTANAKAYYRCSVCGDAPASGTWAVGTLCPQNTVSTCTKCGEKQ